MPLYEYACRDCGNTFERRVKYEDRLAEQSCPQCGGADVRLQLSSPGLVGISVGTGTSGAVKGGSGDFGGACGPGGCCCGG